MTERVILTVYDADSAPFNRATAGVERRLDRFNTNVSQRLDRFDTRFAQSARQVRLVQTAIAGLLGGRAVREVGNYADAFTSVENKLRSIGALTDENMRKHTAASLRTRTNIDADATAVQRFAKATDDGFDAALRRVETVNKLLRSNSTSPTESASVLLQVTQALRSELAGEELRAIRENAPLVFQEKIREVILEQKDALADLAASIGGSPKVILAALRNLEGGELGALKRLASEHVIRPEVVIEAIDRLQHIADSEFRLVEKTVGDAKQTVRTGLTAFVGATDDALDASERITGGLTDLANFLAENKDVGKDFAESLELIAEAALVVAGARGIGAVVTSTRSMIAERRNALRLAEDEAIAARSHRVQLEKEANQKRVLLGLALREGEGVRKLVSARKQMDTAFVNMGKASDNYLGAVGRLEEAKRRANPVVAAFGKTMAGIKGTVSFLGGPLGLALLAATVLPDLIGATETAADKLDDLESELDAIAVIDDKLAEAKQALADATRAQGDAETAAAALTVDAARKRVEALDSERAARLALARAALAAAEADLGDRSAVDRAAAGAELSRLSLLSTPLEVLARGDRLNRQAAGEEAYTGSVKDLTATIYARQDAGEKLTDAEVKLLEAIAERTELERRAIAARKAVEALSPGLVIPGETPVQPRGATIRGASFSAAPAFNRGTSFGVEASVRPGDVRQAAQETRTLGDAIGRAAARADELGVVSARSLSSMASGLVTARDKSEFLLTSLIDVVAKLAEAEITAHFAGSGGGGSSGGGFLGAIVSGIGSLFSGGFAEGGTIPPGRWGWVGERGPEVAWAGSSPLNIAPVPQMGETGGMRAQRPAIAFSPVTNVSVAGDMSDDSRVRLMRELDARDRRLLEQVPAVIQGVWNDNPDYLS